jgi:hypothetical protein
VSKVVFEVSEEATLANVQGGLEESLEALLKEVLWHGSLASSLPSPSARAKVY